MAKKVRWIPHDQALKLVQEGRLKLKLDSGIARQIARSPRYARDCGPHYRRVWWRSLLQIPVYVLLFFVYLYFNGQGRPLDFFLLMLALWLMDLLFTRPSKQNKPEEEEPIVREALEERGLYELIASLGAWEYKPSSIIEEISREAAAASEDLPAVEFDLGLETAKKQKSYEEALKCYGKKPKKIKAAEFLHKLILNSPHYPEKRRRLWNLESGFFTVLNVSGVFADAFGGRPVCLVRVSSSSVFSAGRLVSFRLGPHGPGCAFFISSGLSFAGRYLGTGSEKSKAL